MGLFTGFYGMYIKYTSILLSCIPNGRNSQLFLNLLRVQDMRCLLQSSLQNFHSITEHLLDNSNVQLSVYYDASCNLKFNIPLAKSTRAESLTDQLC